MATAPLIPPHKRHDLFTKISVGSIRLTGGRWGFIAAFGAVLVWALTGPFFDYSQNWQLVINTGTSVVTFLMVFLIQNVQNRESKAIHIKLDELIFAVKQARNELIDIETLTEDQLDLIGERYKRVAKRHEHELIETLTPASAAETAIHHHMTVK